MALTIRRRVVRWGNGFGLRLTRREVSQLGIEAGDEVEAEVFGPTPRESIEKLAIFDFGGDYDIDELIGEDLAGDH